jgi:hypothetical protein
MGWAVAAASTTTTAAAASEGAPTWATWTALVVSVLALLASGWSALSAHRSARSAAEAVTLERDRRHDKLTPRIEVKDGDANGDREGLVFVNHGPRDCTAVHFELEAPAEPSPIVALQVGGAWIFVSEQSPTAGDLGPLRVRDRCFVPYERVKPDRGGILRFRITCTNGQDTWTVPAEVEIMPPPVAIRL